MVIGVELSDMLCVDPDGGTVDCDAEAANRILEDGGRMGDCAMALSL